MAGLPEGSLTAAEAALCARPLVAADELAAAAADPAALAARGAAERVAALERHSPRLLRQAPGESG